MSPADHNKTLSLLYLLLGGVFTLPLLTAPWVIARNIYSFPSPKREARVIVAVAAFCVVFLLALLFYSTAAALHRRKPSGRKLGLGVAVLLLPFCPPLAAYTWWFFHSAGGKQIYGEPRE